MVGEMDELWATARDFQPDLVLPQVLIDLRLEARKDHCQL